MSTKTTTTMSDTFETGKVRAVRPNLNWYDLCVVGLVLVSGVGTFCRILGA